MTGPAKQHQERVLFSLLLGGLIVAAVAMVREGPHFDNVIDGWRFFIMAFFSGLMLGFIAWVRLSGTEPKLSLSGADRHPWLAALVVALAAACGGSFVNRSFSTPTGRYVTAEIDKVEDGRGDRWHVTAKLPDGVHHRFLVPKEAATALKDERAVRLAVSRGMLGYDFYSSFEPVRR